MASSPYKNTRSVKGSPPPVSYLQPGTCWLPCLPPVPGLPLQVEGWLSSVSRCRSCVLENGGLIDTKQTGGEALKRQYTSVRQRHNSVNKRRSVTSRYFLLPSSWNSFSVKPPRLLFANVTHEKWSRSVTVYPPKPVALPVLFCFHFRFLHVGQENKVSVKFNLNMKKIKSLIELLVNFLVSSIALITLA